MKRIYYSLLPGVALMIGTLTTGCSTEEPFGTDGEGELRMKMVINSDVTRAETDEDALRSNCVVYISGANGLLHKWKGLENVPESIMLKGGNYVAEAWTGDSVSASFDKKFYRGYQPFTIQQGVNPVVVNCKIANVVVSINPATVDASLMKDWKITVANSRASLDFTADNMDYAKGYFMMPNADTELKYTITGTNMEGRAFTHTGAIQNPERAHEYVLNLSYNPQYQEQGGAFVTITVDDSEILVEDEIPLFSRPAIKGVGYDADKQTVGNAGAFKDQLVKVTAFGGITNLHLSTDEADAFSVLNHDTDLMHMTETVAGEIKNAGISWDYKYNEERNLATSYITLGAALLNTLPERDQEYTLKVSVTDKYGKTTEQTLRFAVGEGAVVIDDPVMLPEELSSDLLSIGSTTATLNGLIVDASAANPGIRIREAGTGGAWVTAPASGEAVAKAARRHLTPAQARRAKGTAFTVKFKNLKPATRYEVQAVADGFESESRYITTEDVFAIPNGGMEEWSTFNLKSGNALIANAGNQRTFWDSGNHGSIMMGINLTQNSSDMIHGGSTSARLKSQFVGLGGFAGKFAAGNLFAGTYLETQGTDGRLEFGRPYDGSHPSALRLWANYRPGTVVSGNNKGSGDKLAVGATDEAQIFVALSTAPVEVRTKKSNQKLFNPNDPEIVAYGETTWTSAFGPDGALQQLDIPIKYYDKAKTTKPLYLIIVVTASKYGDFFQGGEGSLMYVDDFQLVYE